MTNACCCVKSQTAVTTSAGVLIIAWAIQLLVTLARFISAIQWSHSNPNHKEGGIDVGVSGLLVIVDSSQISLSIMLLFASFSRDLNKLQPWFIFTGMILTAQIPLCITAFLLEVTTMLEFIFTLIFIVMTVCTVWIAREFRQQICAEVPAERLL